MVFVAFLHPDLGIGGAERLVVDAAVSLKNNGHSVHIITNHHSADHSFSETRDGTLSVTVVGDWLPRTILGKFYGLCAYIRMLYAAIYLVLFSSLKPDVIFCDQVSICIPVVRLKVKHVIFYCHFPDQLLSQPGGWWKAMYRKPLNWLEEKTTGMADKILVNSSFTQGVFKATFRSVKVVPDVLYPSINTSVFNTEDLDNSLVYPNKVVYLSINRYERKKNLSLAICSFSLLKEKLGSSDILLVVAGGYDPLVTENIDYYEELNKLVNALGIKNHVVFLKSPTDQQKITLLKTCRCVLYTPKNEHFGIVPLEAMYCKKPVIAVNNGGPVETVLHNITGFLCAPNEEEFSNAMFQCYKDSCFAAGLGAAGHRRFMEFFSFQSFSRNLDSVITETLLSKTK